MYWFKLRVWVAALMLIAYWSACKPDSKEAGTGLKYFNVKEYFTANAARLQKLNKPVLKTVTHNGVTETKTVKIENWGQELDLFIGADINKPAWKNSYTVIDNNDGLLYKAKDPELKVREILIKKEGQKIKWILIFTHTKNILYQTTEKLSYYPDSLYIIEKGQTVKLMGSNHYIIKGVIAN